MSIIQNILLWELIGWWWSILCVHSPLPDPWLSWALIWTSCMHKDPNLAAPTLLGNDATVSMGGLLAFPLLFLSDWSYSCCHGRAGSALPPYLRYKYKLSGMYGLASIFIAVLVIYKWRLGTMGAPYNGWAQMCCGLAMAGACTKHQPCYWSQTEQHNNKIPA